MPATFEEDALYTPANEQKSRMLMWLQHAITMIGALPRRVLEADDSTVRAACIESFYVNVRLLAEFLRATEARGDFSARNFGWSKPEGDAAVAAKEWHRIVSKWVAHNSRKRLSDAPNDEDIDDLMSRAAHDLFSLAGGFVAHLERQQPARAPMLRAALDEAHEELRAFDDRRRGSGV